MQFLKETGINWLEKRWMSRLYMDQSVKLKLDQGETRSMKTGRGVTQGCCLLPILFNLYSDTLPRKLLKGLETSK
jgi:hypothetical protein